MNFGKYLLGGLVCGHNHIHASSKSAFSLAWFLLHSKKALKKNFVFFSLTFVLAALLFVAERGLSLVVA